MLVIVTMGKSQRYLQSQINDAEESQCFDVIAML